MSDEIPICDELREKGFDEELFKLIVLMFMYNANKERADSDENLS